MAKQEKSWLDCPLCPLKQGGDVSGCCVALRAELRKVAQQQSDKKGESDRD